MSQQESPPPNPYPRTNPPSCSHLINHSSLFTPATVYHVGPEANDEDKEVHVYVGYNLANITFIRTTKGWVVVDTGEDMEQMANVWEHLNAKIPKEERTKVYAVILTHHHGDHVAGTQFLINNNLFVDKPIIIGADNLDSEYQQENGLIAPLMTCRAMAQYNSLLLQSGNPQDTAGMNSGIGPIITIKSVGYVPPTHKFPTDEPYVVKKLKIDDVELDLEIVYVPSEANSEIALYHRAKKILFSAEVIQDHTFPNLYTLRGSNFRDPSNWYKSIDSFLNNFGDAEYMVLQHGPPILKNQITTDKNDDITTQPITKVLTMYRDAIQYVRDQTLRWAMKGYAKDEIIHLVKLPDNLENYTPWLQQFYGTVKHSIPAVYNGYIGWFDGDPVALNPLPRSIISKRLISMMGDRNAVIAAGDNAYREGLKLAAKYDEINARGNPNKVPQTELDKLIGLAHEEWQFAAELATLLIRERPYDTALLEKDSNTTHPRHLLHPVDSDGDTIWWNARYLKGACFREMGFRNICANWRGTYLTAGYELEGKYFLPGLSNSMKLAERQSAKYSSVEYSISELQVRVNPEACKTDSVKVYLEEKKADSTTAVYCMQIRHKVLLANDFTGPVPNDALKISGSTEALNLLLFGDEEGGYNSVLEPGSQYNVTITPEKGGLAVAQNFFSHFDGGRFSTSPNIYVH